jgi:hypothetical protein
MIKSVEAPVLVSQLLSAVKRRRRNLGKLARFWWIGHHPRIRVEYEAILDNRDLAYKSCLLNYNARLKVKNESKKCFKRDCDTFLMNYAEVRAVFTDTELG